MNPPRAQKIRHSGSPNAIRTMGTSAGHARSFRSFAISSTIRVALTTVPGRLNYARQFTKPYGRTYSTCTISRMITNAQLTKKDALPTHRARLAWRHEPKRTARRRRSGGASDYVDGWDGGLPSEARCAECPVPRSPGRPTDGGLGSKDLGRGLGSKDSGR